MLTTALKDWSAITTLLAQGHVCLTLRKGGIHEPAGPGVFELEHPQFLLYPAYEHQKPQGLRDDLRPLVDATPMPEPNEITLHAWAEAAAILHVPDRAQLDPLRDLLPWSQSMIDMRFDYKPDRPVYAVLLRVVRLPAPVGGVENHPEYRGCRSWVPLRPEHETIPATGTPALSDDQLTEARTRLQNALARTRSRTSQ
ncbi:DUF1802 family protein [Mucisphaera sp.]|uniref:DUF1802 family protein n=1 Tax=Mucisphaera sp. TaxID=2913024 RepID=UPI003D1368A9